jgi:iron complex transport system substrate-binding protein
MAADQKTLKALTLTLSLWLAALVLAAPGHQVAPSRTPAIRRVISLVPNVTEMIYAIGAGDRVVAVSSYDTYPPEVKKLPNVGALLDPNLELILSLKPDLVVVYGSQEDLAKQLTKAGIGVFAYRHGGLAAISATARDLGARLGSAPQADALATRIESGLDDIRRRTAGRPKVRTLLVFGRERLSLRGVYVSGGVGFLQEMLDAAGGENVFADVRTESVQASTEQIIARHPDVIVETRAANNAFKSGERDAEAGAWNVLGAVPAVRDHRLYFLFDDRIVIPGPRIIEGALVMARTLHPDAFQ